MALSWNLIYLYVLVLFLHNLGKWGFADVCKDVVNVEFQNAHKWGRGCYSCDVIA